MKSFRKLLCLGVCPLATIVIVTPQVANAMSGPTAIQIDGGPLGQLLLSGGVDGLFYGLSGTQRYSDTAGVNAPGTNNAGPNAYGAQLMNSLITLQKATGVVQATVEVGSTNFAYLGLGLVPSSIQSFSTGPLYAGYITIAPPDMPFTVSAGQVTGLEGYEATQDYNNANIFLTQIAYVQTGQSRAVAANYTAGKISAAVQFGDGYDTGVFNTLEALLTYTFNSSNAANLYYGGNLGKTGVNANTYGSGAFPYNESHVGAAPEYANSQMIGAYYSNTTGNLTLVPEVQYQIAKADASVGIAKLTSNLAAAVFGDYSFGTTSYSLGGWVEYFNQHESAADAANGIYWYYGPNASGEAISLTPTWQSKDLFVRADMGVLYLNKTSAYGLASYGYGNNHESHAQVTGLLEAGLLF